MEAQQEQLLLQFLTQEMDIPCQSLERVVRQCDAAAGSLPIILWQYGFINIHQLQQVFDWLDTSYLAG
ncbi:DUF2949 domain-containing protein [Aphanothece hegewaldii CCALA 016]|uniref:DUF2949 domain-containing protein n=1 Tax=Aphanothece hegewaldii CCALA 016 TaxID=2107694 RepID=A0A2T1LUR1_9CHRO|nr:DUF2949 domain-containing protein [Aphanothece hegewaldii]PSF35302.1 DUF2949 domain-containing protein [Aphanothece hegewaldii CCALA 016]